jgi:hypothetical protein
MRVSASLRLTYGLDLHRKILASSSARDLRAH